MSQPRLFALIAAPVVGIALAWGFWPAPAAQSQTVVLPELTGEAIIGARAYEARCAACHGVNGIGVEGAGPPFLHKIYEPSHHGDGAFFYAALNGVQAHHWPYGNMPPVEGITEAEVAAIVQYVRALQQANGI